MTSSEFNTLFTKKSSVKTSLIFTLFSVILLTISILGGYADNDALLNLSFINVIGQLIFSIIVLIYIFRKKENYKILIPFLFLNWFIGCFSTNLFISIFENLPLWAYLVTFTFCLTNFVIYNQLNLNKISTLCYFLNGASFLLIIYYAIYLIPFLPISAMGIMVVGLGFNGFVPLVVSIWHGIKISVTQTQRTNQWAFVAGITTIIIGSSIFVMLLRNEVTKINKNNITQNFGETNNDLPEYIKLSQKLKPNFLNEIILKQDLTYVATDNFFQFRHFGGFGSKQYNERKKHDPLINTAYLFCEPLNISQDDQISLLKSNFDKRLETEEQLWSGEDLITKNIKEDVKIYSTEHLAYTEITMNVACDKKSWRDKEAIYSFQLPEGAVATSLSLWVNGVERKGVLTTKEKAKAAYDKIVGVEMRDPSLMQWREGNRVVVRVFPISEKLPRTFKCGFTTPLLVANNKLNYESIQIKGPNINGAETISRIQVVGNAKLETSKDFETKNGFLINESIGLDNWTASLPLTIIKPNNGFVWKKKVYEIKNIIAEITPFTPSEIVLDLSETWTVEEIENILKKTKKNYFVYLNHQKKAITLNNYKSIKENFNEYIYSLLPLYQLVPNSLVVTKSNKVSANFEELTGSEFLEKTKKKAAKNNIKVINISENINPYWQTIKEQNYASFINADLKNCIDYINKNEYPGYQKSENSINIDQAKISITETENTNQFKNTGSNHIYRMYAFNQVLNEQVKIQNDSLKQNAFVDLAKDANIVTPISSLIVLETDEDYKNNGIEKNANTLGNANINNDGAVPEPHEWALIIIGCMMLLFYYKKQRTTTC